MHFNNFWSAFAREGTIGKFAGHVGEQQVAAHAWAARADVKLPASSNQEGWDLLINGHPLQVKTIADANQLYRHFADNAGIPPIIPHDAANIPKDAIHFDPAQGISEDLASVLAAQSDTVIVDHAL